ncbi:Uncharacterised protein [Achromobacter xylosoxidans]|nr:Uncharacterised protein [Achromobacter xylosoxidans]
MVWSAMPTLPATPSEAVPCTASVLPVPDTRRSPAKRLAAPVVASPYCSVPPVTSAAPPSWFSTTSLPPDTVVLPRNAPLSPVRRVVPAIWFRPWEPLPTLASRVANA